MSTNQSKHTISETIHGVMETIVEKGEAAVDKVKEWTGVEITDDIDKIKKRATRKNAEQVYLKEEMQEELTTNHEEQKPVEIKEEYKEQRAVIEIAQFMNKPQADRKEEMQEELTKENKEIPAFDEKSMMDKVKETFDKKNMNEAMDKAKEIWDTTTTKLTEKTGVVVEKVKEMAGMETPSETDKIKGQALKENPEQVRAKEAVHRELFSEQKEEQPIEIPKENVDFYVQQRRKEEMQEELTKENKPISAFNERTMMDKMKETFDKKNMNEAMDKAKEIWDTTTTKLTEKTGVVVERVKDMAGIENTINPDKVKGQALKENPEQVRAKQGMERELLAEQKIAQPIEIPKEHEQYIQQRRKEEMQEELTKENKEIPAFDAKSMKERMKETFDKKNMNEAMDKAKDFWDTTTTKLTEKTGEVVGKVKDMAGIEYTSDPEKVKGKAMRTNPDQAKAKHELQRELLSEQKEEKPISFTLSKEQEGEIQKQRKQEMQKELTKENKTIPAFNEKSTTMEKVKGALNTTTSTISEKSGTAVEKVKEWTGMKDSKESIQKIKDKAVDKNPEQAKMKQQMQKELLDQNKKESPITTQKDDKTGNMRGKDRKFASDKEKKQYEEQLRASNKI